MRFSTIIDLLKVDLVEGVGSKRRMKQLTNIGLLFCFVFTIKGICDTKKYDQLHLFKLKIIMFLIQQLRGKCTAPHIHSSCPLPAYQLGWERRLLIFPHGHTGICTSKDLRNFRIKKCFLLQSLNPYLEANLLTS